MKSFKIFSLVLLLCPILCFGQNEEEAVKKTIDILFMGMQKSDSAMVRSVFVEDVKMQTVVKNQAEKVGIREGNLSGFLTSIHNAEENFLNEKLKGYDIKIDGPMAHVWTPYDFYLGDKFSHCGVNSFQLAKLDGDWKIIYLVDTRNREGCK